MKTRPSSSKTTGLLARELAERRAVAEREPLAQREPGERAVHRPGVEVAEAEPLRELARDGALAGAGGAVDGDDHRLREGLEEVEEAGEAILPTHSAPCDSDALARDEPCNGAEHRDAVVAARVDLAAARPGRDAA